MALGAANYFIWDSTRKTGINYNSGGNSAHAASCYLLISTWVPSREFQRQMLPSSLRLKPRVPPVHRCRPIPKNHPSQTLRVALRSGENVYQGGELKEAQQNTRTAESSHTRDQPSYCRCGTASHRLSLQCPDPHRLASLLAAGHSAPAPLLLTTAGCLHGRGVVAPAPSLFADSAAPPFSFML